MLEIPAHDLYQLLTQASLFAHQTSELPSINAVALEFTGSELLAVATDRFKLAAIRYPIPVKDPDAELPIPWKTSLPLDQVKLLTGHLKTPRGLQSVRHVTIDINGGNALGIRDALAPSIFNVSNTESKVSVTITPSSPNPFPEWRRLVVVPDVDGDRPGLDCIRFSSQHMDAVFKLSKLRGHNSLAFMFTSPQQRVVVHVDQDCMAIVMPYRLEGKPVPPNWLFRGEPVGGSKS